MSAQQDFPATRDGLAAAAAAFARDGVVCVRGVLGPAELAEAKAAIEQVLASPEPADAGGEQRRRPRHVHRGLLQMERDAALEELARFCRCRASRPS